MLEYVSYQHFFPLLPFYRKEIERYLDRQESIEYRLRFLMLCQCSLEGLCCYFLRQGELVRRQKGDDYYAYPGLYRALIAYGDYIYLLSFTYETTRFHKRQPGTFEKVEADSRDFYYYELNQHRVYNHYPNGYALSVNGGVTRYLSDKTVPVPEPIAHIYSTNFYAIDETRPVMLLLGASGIWYGLGYNCDQLLWQGMDGWCSAITPHGAVVRKKSWWCQIFKNLPQLEQKR